VNKQANPLESMGYWIPCHSSDGGLLKVVMSACGMASGRERRPRQAYFTCIRHKN